MENSVEGPQKLKIELPYDPATSLLGIDTCTPRFMAVLFTTARTWKQPRCLTTEEWVKKTWCIYTMEYYSAIKRNEIELFVETWMDLECHTKWSKSEREKQTSYINACMWNLEKWYRRSYLQSRKRHRHREQIYGYHGGKGGGGMDWETEIDAYTL